MSSTTAAARGSMGKIIAVVAVVIVAAAALGFYALSSHSGIKTVTIGVPSGTGNSNGALNFSPQNIVVVLNVNNTVSWANNDNTVHTVTFTTTPSGTGSIGDSSLGGGQTYTVTLTVPGVYDYKCTIHAWMQGTITVVQ